MHETARTLAAIAGLLAACLLVWATPAPRAGDAAENAIGIQLVRVPAGQFQIGSPPDEKGRHYDEEQRAVQVTKAFYMAATEVTQAQWQALMGFNPARQQGDDLPVCRVSWKQAVAFCEKLSRSEGERLGKRAVYRLPTEAEWEYACRAGEKGAYSGGALDDVAWHLDNSGEAPHPVARKKPNAWGLYDMHGNAMEWCTDWYSPSRPEGPATDPQGPSESAVSPRARVARGGSWRHFPRACRAAARASAPPTYQYDYLGFRVLLELEAQDPNGEKPR